MSDEREPITMHIQTDALGGRTVTVQHWPERSSIADCLWDRADGTALVCDGDRVVFTVANGRATYRVTKHDEVREVRLIELVSAGAGA